MPGRSFPRVAKQPLNALYILASVPEINRRNIMITMGLGALGAAMSLPEAWAHPSPPTAPADAGAREPTFSATSSTDRPAKAPI